MQQYSEKSDFVLSPHGVWLKKNWLDATFNFYCRDSYEPLLAEYLSAQTENFSFIDIGANQGLYSLIAAQNPACRKVLAFEPVKKTYHLLAKNIKANKGSKKIHSYRLAISDKSQKTKISIKPGHSGAATLRKPFWSLFQRGQTIQTIGPEKLRSLQPTGSLIIKVDVEGHEDVVMNTLAQAAYYKMTRAVFFEVNDRWSNAEKLIDLLRQQGFTQFLRTKEGSKYDLLATKK